MEEWKDLERSLVLAARGGDREAFAQLYDHYVSAIYRYVYYRCGHKETAEDLVSQIFMKALVAMPRFDGEYFSAWLYRIARNLLIDHYRRQGRELPLDILSEKADKTSGMSLDDRLSLQASLMMLSEAEREIVTMRIWDGLSYAEIAELMGKSEASQKMAYARAVEKMRTTSLVSLLLFAIAISGK